MKTRLLFLTALTLVTPLVLGQTNCPDQVYLPLTGYSVTLDPAQIAYDHERPDDPNYATRKKLLLGLIYAPVGMTVTRVARVCDLDADGLQMRVQDGTLEILDDAGKPKAVTPVDGWYNLDPLGRYRWSYHATGVGITYHWIEARDVRVPAPEPGTTWVDDARTTRGTVVIVARPRNLPPVLY